MQIVQKIFTEPLVHFLIIGVILYAYYDFNAPQSKDKTIINISSYEIEKIKSDHQNSDEEYVKILIKKKFYDRALLNEAYALDLHTQNQNISELLLKQMNQIMLNATPLQEPSEKELYKYYEENIIDYSKVEQLSFSHILLKDNQANKTLEMLRVLDINAELNFTEKVENVSYSETIKEYGKYFAFKIFKLKKGLWHGAIESKFGKHLVYIREKNITKAIPFDEVQDRVYEDYMDENRNIIFQNALRKIMTQYSLEVK